MKTLITLLVCFKLQQVQAQDYFSIIKKTDDITYNYPSNVQMVLTDSLGNTKTISKDDAITVTGNYTLCIEVPWSKQPEIIKSDGGLLEIFVLPKEKRNSVYKGQPYEMTRYNTIDTSNKPRLEQKEIIVSNKDSNNYNLIAVFTNGVVFKYEDGYVTAWVDGDEVTVSNHYLVNSPEGILKISFDPKDGEFWYVFDI